jgi:hypothetical protein
LIDAFREESFLGLGKWWNDIREKGHIVSETIGTIRAAYDLQSTLSKLHNEEEPSASSKGDAKASKSQALTDEQKSQLEQQAAEKGLNTLWKSSKLEVESVVRDVCDAVLSPVIMFPDGQSVSVPKDVLKRRAIALKLIGNIYESTRLS